MFSFLAGFAENQILCFWGSDYQENVPNQSVFLHVCFGRLNKLFHNQQNIPKVPVAFMWTGFIYLSGFWCCMLWKSNHYTHNDMFLRKMTITFCPVIQWWLYFMCNGCTLAFMIWLTVPGAALSTSFSPTNNGSEMLFSFICNRIWGTD